MGSLATDKFSLHWKDFESNLAHSVSDMRNDSNFFDVKIACFDNKSEMKTIPAHKMVLSACSPIFKELLCAIGTADSQNPMVFLRGISFQEISAILDFMYSGETKVEHNEFDAFLAAAKDLQIRGLSEENQRNEGNSNNSTPSGKRPSQDKLQENDDLENDVSLKSEIKKTLSPISSFSSMGVFIPEGNFENVTVKVEQVGHEDEDDYQDHTKTEMLDPFDESSYQDYDKTGAEKSMDCEGMDVSFIFL